MPKCKPEYVTFADGQSRHRALFWQTERKLWADEDGRPSRHGLADVTFETLDALRKWTPGPVISLM